MSASIAPPRASAPTLWESGYHGHPYHHSDLNLAPVMFMWWARTPSGRQSKFWKTHCFNRLQHSGKLKKHDGYLVPVVIPTQHFAVTTQELYERLKSRGTRNCCPQLPKGYEWLGPFLYSESTPPAKEGSNGGPNWFAFRAPEHSDGIPLRYVCDDVRTLDGARQIAVRLLASRPST